MRDPFPLSPAAFPARVLQVILPLGIGLMLVACQATSLRPPRLEKPTSQPDLIATADPIFLPAPTATPGAAATEEPFLETGPNPSLDIWINETSEAHKQALAQLKESFERQYPISIAWVLVSPSLLPELMETAVISGTLPDIVLHPFDYTAGWAEQGILDAAAADEILNEMGRDSFNPDALAALTRDGITAALPSDGYQQLLIYRTDWAGALGLSEPDNFEAMLAMAAATFDPTNVVSGIVIPTEANLITTQRAFEHLAVANGCQLVDEKGEILIRDSVCQEALDFYFSIVNQYSPVGVQTDTSTRNAYLAGQTAMILSSPAILPRLAGLDRKAMPTCPECSVPGDYLARNSGILTRLSGSAGAAVPANFGEITALGITPTADKQAAAAFARFWFSEGYETWLAVESERKVPMRWGTASQPRQFIDSWGTQPLLDSSLSLLDIYGQTVVDQLRAPVAASNRWGFKQGQAPLITTLHQAFILPVVLQEMLSGYFDSRQTILEIYDRITDLIPNYEYYSSTDPADASGG